jgi:hypothetical protein
MAFQCTSATKYRFDDLRSIIITVIIIIVRSKRVETLSWTIPNVYRPRPFCVRARSGFDHEVRFGFRILTKTYAWERKKKRPWSSDGGRERLNYLKTPVQKGAQRFGRKHAWRRDTELFPPRTSLRFGLQWRARTMRRLRPYVRDPSSGTLYDVSACEHDI